MLKADLAKLEREVAHVLDRIADAKSPTVVKAYEVPLRNDAFRTADRLTLQAVD